MLMADRKVIRTIDNCDPVSIDVLFMESKLLGFNLLLGIDVIEILGAAFITKMGEIPYLCSHYCKLAQLYHGI